MLQPDALQHSLTLRLIRVIVSRGAGCIWEGRRQQAVALTKIRSSEMTRIKALLAGGTIAAATALSAAAVTAAPGDGPARADGPKGPGQHGIHKARGDGHGWKHHRRGGFCGKHGGGHLGRKLGLIETLMDLSQEQQTALNDLKGTLEDGRETLKASCEARRDEGRPKTAIEGMDRFEQAMTSRLEVMRTIKPAFEKFYTTLSEKQQKAVDDLFTRRGHRGKRG
jgi:hypothetical protein